MSALARLKILARRNSLLTALLLTGCAEYSGDKHRSAELELRVPGHDRAAVAAQAEQVTQMVGAIAVQHGLTLVQEKRRAGGDLYAVPGVAGFPWPGQPDVDWFGGSTWKRSLPRKDDLPDKLQISVLPPLSGRVLEILQWTTYAARKPPEAQALWDEVLAATTSRYGRDALVKVEVEK